MRAWVAKRRDAGVLLESPSRVGEMLAPFELLVMDVTDQGQRRPTKVARLMPIGARVAIIELISPKLVWFKNWEFVLSGTEEVVDALGKQSVAQSWLCKLALPNSSMKLKAVHTHKEGHELPRRTLFDRFSINTKGMLSITSCHASALGRHTILAEIRSEATTRAPEAALIDSELDWMSEERFSLSGFQQCAAHDEQSARLLRHGWLCELHVEEAAEVN